MRIDGSVGLGGALLLTPAEVAATSRTHEPRPRAPGTARRPWVRRSAIPWRLLGTTVVFALVTIALIAHTYALATLPGERNDDQATVGLEAQRILREGRIAPQPEDATAQPTGPIYLTALAIKVFGNTSFAVRFAPALSGTLTLLVLFVVVARSFGVATALLSALSWHVLVARVGLPLETWPLCMVLTTGALVEAVRHKRWHWWAAAGAFAGLGIYTSSAHPVFIAIVGLFVAIAALQGIAREGQPGLAPFLLGPLLLAVVLSAAAWPMIDFARDPARHYVEQRRAASIFAQPEWAEQTTTLERARFLGERYRAFWVAACCQPVVDGEEAASMVPLIPAAVLLLACLGAIMGLLQSQPLALLGSLSLLLIPWAAILTLQAGTERAFAAAPFLALLAALPAGWLVEQVALIVVPLRYAPSTSRIASAMPLTSVSTSWAVITSGGEIAMPASLQRKIRPRRRVAACSLPPTPSAAAKACFVPLSLTNSTIAISPLPRTSPTCAWPSS